MYKKYLLLQNKDGKKWLLHENKLKTALCLYQPSSAKGILVKKMLPVLVKIPLIPNVIYEKFGIRRMKKNITPQEKAFFSGLYSDAKDIQFSVFFGTPGTHQKITIQISEEDHILGYCKITENQEIYRIFRHEQNILKYLEVAGITNIPKCIRCEMVGDGRYVFAQTTVKSIYSTVRHELGKPELDFIHTMAERTEKTVSFENTDFYQSIQKLYCKIPSLKEKGFFTENVEKACNCVISYYQQQNTFSACHRDFTPWNTFVENGKMYVFDFEYAGYYYPAYLDAIHYLIQTAIYEKKMSPQDIFALYQNACESGVLKGLFSNPKIALQAYLVDIISLYVTRGEDFLKDEGAVKLLNIWFELLGYILQ